MPGLPSILSDRKKKTFEDLDENTVAILREYLIPTIEIELNDNPSSNSLLN